MNPLPDPCEKCAPFGGRWAEGPKGGMMACDCPRGLALIAMAKPTEPRPPVLPSETLTMCVEMMAEVPFFPSEEGRRGAIAREIASMCETFEQTVWLAMRMVRLYRKWPGCPEMRLVFSQRYHPLDCIEAIGESEVYPDGIPSELPPAKPEPKRLTGKPAAGEISAAQTVEDTVRDLAAAKDLNRTGPPKRVRDIPIRQLKPEERITPEMIQAAVEKHRAEKAVQDNLKARAEIGLEPPIVVTEATVNEDPKEPDVEGT